MKLLSPNHMEALDDLEILPVPCCPNWSDTAQHCPFHSRPNWALGEHILGCAHGEPRWYRCGEREDGEHHFQYIWLGWPGTWCIYCGADDEFESCLMRRCSCRCHHEFWKNYWNIAMREIGVKYDGDLSEL